MAVTATRFAGGFSHPPKVNLVRDCSLLTNPNGDYDVVILIAENIDCLSLQPKFSKIHQLLKNAAKVDQGISSEVSLHYTEFVSGGLFLFSPTGKLNRDYDDVRRFHEAAQAAVARIKVAGCKKPLVMVANVGGAEMQDSQRKLYRYCFEVSLLGLFYGLYEPLEYREHLPTQCEPVQKIGCFFLGASLADQSHQEKLVSNCVSIETGCRVARDIGGSDPERMTPHKIVEYLADVFPHGSPVKMTVLSDLTLLQQQYPLLHAVSRCSLAVQRHHPRLVTLEYCGEGPIQQTLLLVGKGVVYDTGGADIKAGGHMAGMCRDKCGAAALAGFLKTVAMLKPAGLKVVAKLALVRNSVGSDSFVADEIIRSRAGVRVKIGNTDAEGRLAMADPLCEMKELALREKNPLLMTVATLTGHVCVAYGNYAAVLSNGPARRVGVDQMLFRAGELWGDAFEISTIRREDFEFIKSLSLYEDTQQSNNEPSSETPRGHQFPAAFMIRASGLDAHGVDSSSPLPYSHLDVAASALDYPKYPSASPLTALVGAFCGL